MLKLEEKEAGNPVRLLSIQNLSVDFVGEKQVNHAVRGISFDVYRGEILAIVGESGSGKSVTSFSVLQLIPSPPAKFKGSIIFDGEDGRIDLLKASSRELQKIRGKEIAMIFQEPMSSLNPVINCGSQVVEAILAHENIAYAAAKERAIEWFRKVKLPEPESIFYRYPHQLSGGQKQRVMIAMAMSCEPDLLICDEPTTALDVTVQKTILELLVELQRERNMGVIFITHDLGVVSEIADRVVIMFKGEIVETGDKNSVFNDPKHPYTKALIACRPALHPKGEPLPTVNEYLNKSVEPEKFHSKNLAKSNNTDEVILSVEDLTVRYPTKKNLLGKTTAWFTAVDHVNFKIFKGETLGLVGESGCGKTTLGRTLLKLVEPSSGKISYKGSDITKLKSQKDFELRKEVQLVFQDPFSSLNPRLTIGDAIEEPIRHTRGIKDSSSRKKIVAQLLNQVSLPASSSGRYPHQFSGGERQRIVIARAIALQPDFLVCDESVSALDVSVQAQILNLLNDLKRELNLAMLFISHDLSVVHYMCDRIMVMKQGSIIESGPADEIYNHPQSHYTKQLLAAIPNLQR